MYGVKYFVVHRQTCRQTDRQTDRCQSLSLNPAAHMRTRGNKDTVASLLHMVLIPVSRRFKAMVVHPHKQAPPIPPFTFNTSSPLNKGDEEELETEMRPVCNKDTAVSLLHTGLVYLVIKLISCVPACGKYGRGCRCCRLCFPHSKKYL